MIRGTVGPSGELPRHLPSLAAVLAAWPGVAFADLGELHPANPALAIARASVAVLVITRSTVEGLAHLRARIEDLTGSVGDPGRDRSPVGVVTVAGRGDGKRSVDRTAALLGSIGSPVPVLGAFNHDPTGAALLWSGPVTKRLGRSALLRSAGSLMPQIGRLWPELGYAVSPPAAPPVLPAGPAAAVL